MDKVHFTVVAGFDAHTAYEAALDAARQEPGFNLPRWQERNDKWLAAEINVTIYGYNLIYASGLQGFAIICPAQYLGTLDKALSYAQQWAAGAGDRYVFIRNSALAKAGEIAEKVAEREAAARDQERKVALFEHAKGMHVGSFDYAKRCEHCRNAS